VANNNREEIFKEIKINLKNKILLEQKKRLFNLKPFCNKKNVKFNKKPKFLMKKM